MQGANGFSAMLAREQLLQFNVTGASVSEAKGARKQAVFQQKRLRYIKSQLNLEMKYIRNHYSQKSRGAGSRGSFVLKLMLKPGLAGNYRAHAKHVLRAERNAVLLPYERVKTRIDNGITQLDRVKYEIDTFILNS